MDGDRLRRGWGLFEGFGEMRTCTRAASGALFYRGLPWVLDGCAFFTPRYGWDL